MSKLNKLIKDIERAKKFYKDHYILYNPNTIIYLQGIDYCFKKRKLYEVNSSTRFKYYKMKEKIEVEEDILIMNKIIKMTGFL